VRGESVLIICLLPYCIQGRAWLHCVVDRFIGRVITKNACDRMGREWCYGQVSKSNFGVVWRWPFDLVTQKLSFHRRLPRGPLVPICSKFGSFVFKMLCPQDSQQTNERTDGRTNERAGQEHSAIFNDLERPLLSVSISCHPFFDAEYLRNGTRYSHSLNENYLWDLRPTQQCHFEWPWVTLMT